MSRTHLKFLHIHFADIYFVRVGYVVGDVILANRIECIIIELWNISLRGIPPIVFAGRYVPSKRIIIWKFSLN